MEEGERTWRLTKRSYPVHSEVTAPVYDAMLRIVKSGAYLNLSKYVGDLIEKDVEERGIELESMEVLIGEEKGGAVRPRITVDTRIVNTRVSLPMVKGVNMVLGSGFYLSVSDYFRDVIKKDLESRGFEPTPIKDVEEREFSKMWRPSEVETVSTQVPMPMMERIDLLLGSGVYFRVSDYLIDLIKNDLESRGLGPDLREEK